MRRFKAHCATACLTPCATSTWAATSSGSRCATCCPSRTAPPSASPPSGCSSGRAAWATPQVLFRFRPGSQGLEPLRALSTPGMPDVGGGHRLFRLGGRQLLQGRDLYELPPSGAPGRVVRALPSSTVSLGASGGRWLLLRTGGETVASVTHRAYDARTGRLTEAFAHADFCRVAPRRPYALFGVSGREGEAVWPVRLSDGRRTRIEGKAPARLGWPRDRPHSDPLLAWSADTGGLVAQPPREGTLEVRATAIGGATSPSSAATRTRARRAEISRSR